MRSHLGDARSIALLLMVAPMALAQDRPGDETFAREASRFIRLATQSRNWNEPADPAHIVGPIYFVGTQGLGVFLIKTAEGHILINSGMPPSGPLIEQSIRKLGLDPRDVKLILANHAHIDHVAGHAHLKKVTGAQIAMLDAEVPLLESGGKTDFHYGSVPDMQFDPVKVDRVLRDGEEIKLGDIALTILHTPGHTRGSATFVTHIVENGKIFTVVFPNGTSVNPGYRLINDPSYPGICDDMRRSHHIFETLKPDIWLPPHNEVIDLHTRLARRTTQGIKALIDPDGYRKWIADQRTKLDAAIDKELGVTNPTTELITPKSLSR